MQIKKYFSEIEELLEPLSLITKVRKQSDVFLTKIGTPEKPEPSDLVFYWEKSSLQSATRYTAGAIIVDEKILNQLQTNCPVVFTSPNPRLSMALVGQHLSTLPKSGIHPTATIHPTAKIDPTCYIGANTVIGSDVIISAHTSISSHVVIEDEVVIGKKGQIGSHCFLGNKSRLGDRVRLKNGAVIGSEGFGFANEGPQFYALPHQGNVVIGDDVHIGAQTCIDRAVFNATKIGSGTKIDNLCHIAHNVTIGENCIITAGFCVAGSTKIGNRVMTGGQTGIFPHLEIADDVHLNFRAGVTESIPEAGAYAGLPAKPMRTFLKNTAIANKLVELRKKILTIEKKLAATECSQED